MVDTKKFQPGQVLDLHDVEAAIPGPYPEGGDLTGKWLVERVLGTGQYSVVLSVKPKNGGLPLAMKLAPFLKDIERQMRNEFDALKHVRHSHVLCGWAAAWRGDHGMVFVEQLNGGSLWDKLKSYYQQRQLMPVVEGLRAFEQALTALTAVHDAGFIHADLKPENMLRGPDHYHLSDFGFSQRISRMVPGALGSPVYMAPEVYAMKGYTPASDVFAAGCMLQRLVGAREPFFNTEAPVIFANLLADKRTCTAKDVYDTLISRGCPESVAAKLRVLSEAMTAFEPQRRPTAAQAHASFTLALSYEPPAS